MFQTKWFYQADGGGAGSGGAGGSGDGGNVGNGGNGGNGGNSGANKGGGNNDGKQTAPPNFDEWLKGQPNEIKTLLDGHTKGLKSALDSEREARKDLEKQVRDLAGKAEKGSEAQTELTKLADKISESDRRADFFEAAHAAGISNLKLAYTVAVTDEMFDRRGSVNFEMMKQSYPELFAGAAKPPSGNAGAGRTNNQPPASGMNAFIRKAAGRD